MRWVQWVGLLLLVVGAAFGVREVFPREVEIRVPGPPRDTTIVEVQDTVIRADTVFERDTVFTSDTINLVDTLFVADTVRFACGTELEPRRYVRDVRVGEELGATTWIRGTIFSADSAGMNFQSFTEQVWTAGMLSGLAADARGVRVDFRPFPETRKSCGFFDIAPWVGGSVGFGILVGELF